MAGLTYTIFAGGAAAATTTTTILGTASAGTAGAMGTLVHPDSANFPPIVYESNPDRVLNLDNDVLFGRLASTVLTLSDRKLVSQAETIVDVVTTEVWTASGPKVAMTTLFFRLLYEYYVNPPAFSAFAQEYIQWTPAYRNAKTYNVQIIDLTVGGSNDPLGRFDVSDEIPPGGVNDGGDTQHGVDVLTGGVRAGMVDRTVALQMKIVGKVV